MVDEKYKQWIQEIDKKLAKLDRKLSKPLNQPIDMSLIDINNFGESLKKLTEKAAGPDYPILKSQTIPLLVDLLKSYLVVSNEERKLIKGIFQNKPNIRYFLEGFPSYVAKFINSPKDLNWLEIGLVAALLEGGVKDFRDLWSSLGDLYLKAKEVAIDPNPHFERIGTLQTYTFFPGPPGKSILDEFLESAFLKELES